MFVAVKAFFDSGDCPRCAGHLRITGGCFSLDGSKNGQGEYLNWLE
jgi:hypothetical protein